MSTRVALGVLALCAYTVAQSPPTCDSGKYACPSYTLIRKSIAYELRDYGGSSWAVTTGDVTGNKNYVSSKLFGRLHNYLTGGNKQSVRMNMTAPVLTKVTPEGQMTMYFYIPVPYDVIAPVPKDSRVKVISWVNKQFYVRVFDRWGGRDREQENLDDLKRSIRNPQLYDNTPLSTDYDPGFGRKSQSHHKEIWLEKLGNH